MRRKFLRTLAVGLTMGGEPTFAQQETPFHTVVVHKYPDMAQAAVQVKAFALEVSLDSAAVEFSAEHQLSVQNNPTSRGTAAEGVFRLAPQQGGNLGGPGQFRLRPGTSIHGNSGVENTPAGHSLAGRVGDAQTRAIDNFMAQRLNRTSEVSRRLVNDEEQIVGGETSNRLKPVSATLKGIQNEGIVSPDNKSFYVNSLLHLQPAAQPERASKPGGAVPAKGQDWQSPEEEDDRKPAVYRSGRLPRDLPDWFDRLDSDRDGQIGLYEWVRGGRSVDEFRKYDRNDDGFITIEELMSVLRRIPTAVRHES